MACERVKEFLSREGYDFTVKNVDEDDGAYAELMALGWRAVPVTVVAGRAVKGYDVEKLKQILAGMPRSPSRA